MHVQSHRQEIDAMALPQRSLCYIAGLPYTRPSGDMMCGYESQCALQFAAYLFMREKLGINVTFYVYPTRRALEL